MPEFGAQLSEFRLLLVSKEQPVSAEVDEEEDWLAAVGSSLVDSDSATLVCSELLGLFNVVTG